MALTCCSCRAGRDAEANRRWPENKYVELAQRIAGNGVTPVVLGASEERPIGAAIAKAEPGAKNLVTRPDLFQCIALAERASFAVGDDVELMHVAAAAGAPCLVFLSSSTKGPPAAPRGRSGVVEFTAAVIADRPGGPGGPAAQELRRLSPSRYRLMRSQ